MEQTKINYYHRNQVISIHLLVSVVSHCSQTISLDFLEEFEENCRQTHTE